MLGARGGRGQQEGARLFAPPAWQLCVCLVAPEAQRSTSKSEPANARRSANQLDSDTHVVQAQGKGGLGRQQREVRGRLEQLEHMNAAAPFIIVYWQARARTTHASLSSLQGARRERGQQARDLSHLQRGCA